MTSVSDLLDAASKLSWAKLFAAILLLALLGIGFGLYEIYTHSTRLSRSERALAVAEKAEAYLDSIRGQPTVQQLEIYKSAVAEAHSASIESGPDVAATHREPKFFFGLLPWLLMALIFLAGEFASRFAGMFGAVVIGILVASILAYVPDWAWPLGSLALAPAFSWLLVVGVIAFAIRKRRTPS